MLPVHSQGRPGHRRSCFQSTQAGAFTSLGALPQRTNKTPTSHFDQDDGSSSPINDLSPNSFNAVPFPSTSPVDSPTFTKTPTVLKPLKSSLKSSNSSPNIPFPPQSLVPSIMFPDLHPKQQQQHQRANSAPSSPLFASSSPLSTSSSSTSSSSFHHHVPKNVHFPSQEDNLATIRIFKRSARPASLSRPGEETETDTEGEVSSNGLYGNGGWAGWNEKYVGGSTFPFPRVNTANAEKKSPLNPSKKKRVQYNIDWSASSAIPRKNVDRRNENIFIQSLQVVDGDGGETALQGTLLVRNITYQKTVTVRYTMDEWETMNDVSGWYDGNGEGWDRFKFSISLDGQGLEERVMWLVAKYAGGAGESGDAVEWWDNNEGKNYRAGFKKVVNQEEPVEVYKRGVVVSAPTTYTSPTPTSTLTRPKLSEPQISSFTFSGQSTLAGLKKLNLKNYAAPIGYGYGQSSSPPPKFTPPVLTSPMTSSFVRRSGSSTPESASAPNLSLNTTLEMSSPTLSSATTASTTSSRDSTPVQTPRDEDDGEERWKVGDEEEKSLRWSLDMENGHFTTTPLGSPIPVSIPGDRNTTFSYPKSGGVEMDTSSLKESVVERGVGGEGKKEFAYESTNGGGGTGLMPPQRRRGLLQHWRSSSSGNDSNSKNSKLSSPSTPPSTATSITPKQRPKPPKLNIPTPSSSTPPISASVVTSPSGVQSPYPRQGIGPQPQTHGYRYYQSMPSSSTPGNSDAIYQALVREWCFAQGPSSSNSTSGETALVVLKSPNPLGLICASGE